MANYDLTYEGSEVQRILDTGDSLKEAGFIFKGEATPSTVPGTPTERVAYIGGPGTYTNFGESITVPAGCVCIFKYTGSAWTNQVIDAQGASEGIFDLSAYNAQEGVLATYADLNTALTALNALPADFKKGGMSIKFVRTSDNKYKHFNLIADEFTTDATKWLGVDEAISKTKNIKTETIINSEEYIAIENNEGKERVRIFEGDTPFGDDEQVYSNDAETDIYAKIGSYGLKAKKFYYLNGKSVDKFLNIIIVDCNGGGDYTTIEDALNNANDSPTNHVVIYVRCGVYFPAPNVSGNNPYNENYRNISIIGENRNKTILRNNIGYYHWQGPTDCAVLRLNGNVLIENLTIESNSNLYNDYAGVVSGFEAGIHKKAYCIHRDGAGNEGDVFLVKNCILKNDHFAAIGYGLRINQPIILEDCYIESEKAAEYSVAGYGTIYGHTLNSSTGLNQDIAIIRCQVVHKNEPTAIKIDDSKASGATPADTFINLKFISNVCKTTSTQSSFVIASSLETFYAKDELSYGNNVSSMNYNN